MKFWRFFAI